MGTNGSSFGGYAISEYLFDTIRIELLVGGGTILELGSGRGSYELSKHYKVYSIENDEKWLNKYKGVNYIYAPLTKYKPIKRFAEVNLWYDPNKVKAHIPEKYDLLLIDGPSGLYGRAGVLKFFSLFNKDSIIVIDDINREQEYQIMRKISGILKRPFTVYGVWNKRHQFGVIKP
jgi:hypothetical protein